MKTLFTYLITAIATLGLAAAAPAQIILSLEPSPRTINVGDSTAMDLLVTGLGDLSSPSLGAFDVEISYNPAVVAVTSLAFGNSLDLGILGSSRFSELRSAGLIRLDELSFESASDLNSAQADTFTLATFGFKGLTTGISGIDFTYVALSDEQGQAFTGVSTFGGAVAVIPEPNWMAGGIILALSAIVARRCGGAQHPI
jgi:hypothetical protein